MRLRAGYNSFLKLDDMRQLISFLLTVEIGLNDTAYNDMLLITK